MITIFQAIPCILYFENHVGERILKVLLIDALEIRDGEPSASIDKYSNTFESIINTGILGSHYAPSQWSIPKGSDGDMLIGKITMDNNMTRKIINSIKPLIDLSIVDKERRSRFKIGVNHSRTMMTTVHQKDDFTDEEIEIFQEEADVFFRVWVDLHGSGVLTNYVHMLGAGHLSYYFYKWRNLYRYSQQGWESMNHLHKHLF